MRPMNEAPLLEAKGLRKAYGERVAVESVSLQLRAGELLALLGPNGAGKSTTLGMLSGLTVPDAGAVQGGSPARIGLVPQEIALFEQLSAARNVELFGALYGLGRTQLKDRVPQVLAQVGLSDRAGDRPETFSGGMKRRLNIACALVHGPEVLLLDEPTAGVDPQSRNAIFDTLEGLKREGKALLYTTHYMEEAERLADAIVIVDHGRVVAQGTLTQLLAQLPAAQQLQIDLDGPPVPVQTDLHRCQSEDSALQRHQAGAHQGLQDGHRLRPERALQKGLRRRVRHLRRRAIWHPVG